MVYLYFKKKVFVRLNENGHGVSMKIVYEIILAFKSRGTSYLINYFYQNDYRTTATSYIFTFYTKNILC